MIKRFFQRAFKQDNVVQFGIGLIAILILHNFVVALYSKRNTREYNEFLAKQRTVLSRIDQVSTNVNLIDLGFRGYYMITKENLKSPLEIARTQHRENIDSLEIIIGDLGYQHTDSLKIVDGWIKEYFALADKGVEYIDQGNPEMAVEVFASDPGYTLWSKYSKVQESMRSYITNLNQEMLLSNQRVSQYAFVAQLLLAFVGCMTLAFVIYRLRRNNQEINELFGRIKESDRNYVFNEGLKVENENNEKVIERMVRNLRHAADFIKDISNGNLEVQWKNMTKNNARLNEETLAGELINMREQMVRVKADEGNRMWVSEGISTFSEIIRRNQDNLQEMSDRLLAKIVKYLNANQGGLFFAIKDDEETFLEQTSCFAYDKKKFDEKKVSVDAGMLGQAYLEGDIVILKEVPAEYINITSGLGEITPNHLILVPLKFNDEVIGVLELASFTEFTAIHLELLENAQQTAEEMRAQEEEMRQNMEELQATQEELARKETELMKRIEELENEKEAIVPSANK